MPTPSDIIAPRETPTYSRSLLQGCPDELLPISYEAEVWQQSPTESVSVTDTNMLDHYQEVAGVSEIEDGQAGKIGVSIPSDNVYEPQSPSTLSANKQSLLTQKMVSRVNSSNQPADINTSYTPISTRQYEYSALRLTPLLTSSFLRPGTKFVGTQQSDKMTYDVIVELKYVDMRESFLCGHLCIKNLTRENPELTTYFEGEIVGPKYSFLTRKEEWGAKESDDIAHWNRFDAYKPYAKSVRRSNYHHTRDFEQEEYIFMRWKECFLVPEHKVKELAGASFEGFYYICFHQPTGTVEGYYFHNNSEKWQQLDLNVVPSYGEFAAIEFR